MRLSFTVLGWELLAIELGNTADHDHDHDDAESPGDCTTFPVGFVAAHEIPDGSGLPYREGWE